MEIQLSRYGSQKDQSQEIGKPDLAGITEMLRMIDNYYDDSVQENHTVKQAQIKKQENTIISISKLNPNVAEFVPKCDDTMNVISNNKEDLCVNNKLEKDFRNACVKINDVEVICKTDDNGHQNSKCLEDLKETNKTDDFVFNNLMNSPINISDLTQEEVQDMKKKLKAHINGTSNMKCAKVKRQRNLAIANLVNLYSQHTPNNIEECKPKLIAPDYYEKYVPNISKKEPISDIVEGICANGKEFTPTLELKNSKVTKEAIKNMTLSHNSNFTNDTGLESIVNNEKDIAASVDKVEKWLSSSDNSTTTTNDNGCVGKNKIDSPIYLGPITFKRKVSNKTISPMSSDSLENNKVMKTSNFVPSKYASELAEKYMKRDALRKSTENDIWTNLEIKLKARDEEIRKRRESQAESKANDENLVPSSSENLNLETVEESELKEVTKNML